MADPLNNKIFHDATKARTWLEALLWTDSRVCGYCGVTNESTPIKGRDGYYQCNACRKQFTVMVGTVFERSHIPLNKWLMAAFLLCASKKGMSSHQFHRMLGITYKSAWFMAHRLREAMAPLKGAFGPMGGEGKVVEADTTFVGGKEKNKHTSKRKAGNIGGVGKQIVHTRADEYVRGDAHSNTVEGYFSILKRGIIGTYHHVSEAHLKRYLAEFDFRYSQRSGLGVNDSERATKALQGIVGKRLTYRRLDQASNA